MKTILYICENSTEDTEQVKRYIEREEHRIINCLSCAEAKMALDENDDITIILLDTPSELAGVKELIEQVNYANSFLFMTPILIVTNRDHLTQDVDYLGGPVVDVISKPVSNPKILLNRIDNAEKFFQSVSFSDFADMLRVLPANIYLKDRYGRYVFSSQTWHHLDTGNDPNWTIRGKTDLDIRKDKENAKLAMESDKRMLASGKGTSYIIEENQDGIQEYLQLIKEPLFNENHEVRGIIALINNVTEQERMRRQLKELSITDKLTGAYNRTCFENTIEEGFQEEDYPVCILSADCDDLKVMNDTNGHLAGDEYIMASVEAIKNNMGKGGTVFRTGGDEFIAILPHTDKEKAEAVIAAIRKAVSELQIYGHPVRLSLGYDLLGNNDDSLEAVIREADESMYRDKRSHKQQKCTKV